MTTGTEGPDRLVNEFLGDHLFGLGGDDLFALRVTFSYSGVMAIVDGGDGFDTVTVPLGRLSNSPEGGFYSRSGTYQVIRVEYTNVERIIVTGSYEGPGPLILHEAQDWLTLNGSTSGIIRVQTNGGDDVVKLVSGSPGGDIDAGPGDDIIDLSASKPTAAATFLLKGGDGNDKLIGSTVRDTLIGGAGDDNLNGGDEADVLIGNAGTDIYLVDDLDTVIEQAGEGTDAVYSRTSFTLAAGASVELLGTVDYQSTATLTLTGNEIANKVVGNMGDNSLYGLAGDDYLVGLAGVDVLDGGEGADFMDGGAGGDIYYVDDPHDIVLENAGDGYDALYTSVSFSLREEAEVERFGANSNLAGTDIYLTGNGFGQAIIGHSGNNQLAGLGGDDYLVGLAGADILIGGAGIDVLDGGQGNDIFYVEDSLDVVWERAGEGFDAVYVAVGYTLGAGADVELLGTLDYTLTQALDLAGNEVANFIVGNNGANVLRGFAGDDDLNGLEGSDVLDGGAGQDRLTGGAGADTFRFGATADSAAGAADTILDFASGSDRIDLSGIDANSATAVDDAFTWIGAAAFSGKAGELRAEASGGQAFVYADVNGDGTADFQIVVNGVLPASGDFVF
jgi:Ca2+-binding RTX toxin-like protein